MDIARLIDGIGPGAALVKISIGRLAVLDPWDEIDTERSLTIVKTLVGKKCCQGSDTNRLQVRKDQIFAFILNFLSVTLLTVATNSDIVSSQYLCIYLFHV